jgi:hypothetical protein
MNVEYAPGKNAKNSTAKVARLITEDGQLNRVVCLEADGPEQPPSKPLAVVEQNMVAAEVGNDFFG